MRTKAESLQSDPNSRKGNGKNSVFVSPNLSRKYYGDKANLLSNKEKAATINLAGKTPYLFNQIQRQSNQANTPNPSIAELYFHSRFKIDKAILNQNAIARINQADKVDNLPSVPISSLNHLLNIKSMRLVNNKNPLPMNEQPSKFSMSANPVADNQIPQNSEGEALTNSLLARNREGSDEINSPLPSQSKRKKPLEFKITNPSLYVAKHSALIKESLEFSNGNENSPSNDIQTTRVGEAKEDVDQPRNHRSSLESPDHQQFFENNRYTDSEKDSLRQSMLQQSEQTQNQQFEDGKLIGGSKDKYTAARKLQMAEYAQKLSLLQNNNKPNLAFKTLESNPQRQPQASSLLGNRSIANDTVQVTHHNTRSFGTNPNRNQLLPFSNQTINESNANAKNEKNNLSPARIVQLNNPQGPKQSLTNSVTTLTSSTNNAASTNPANLSTANSLSVSNAIGSKSIKHEYLSPEEKEKRRLTYQAPIKQSTTYKYYIGEGNNAELVKRVISKRENWEGTESFNSLFNLKWQQSDRAYRYEQLVGSSNLKQLLNHFEFHTEITTKNGLIKSLSAYCESNKISVFDFTPITFSFDMDDDAGFTSDMHRFTKFFIKHCGDPKKYANYDPSLAKKGKPNVLYTFEFKSKGKTLNILQKSVNDKKISPYLKPKVKGTYYNGCNLWLLKPTGLNRGRGIELFHTLEELNKYINQYLEGEKSPKKKVNKAAEDSGSDSESEEESKAKKGPPGTRVLSHTFVIQKYIEHPLLVNQRKFDIRVYAMVTHEMQLMFFKEGYLRTSSEVYSIGENDFDNKFVHLTNDAVQKYSDKYGQAEQGNKLSYDEFQKYLDDHGIPLDVRGKVIPRMKELIQISMSSVKKVLNQNDRKFCFEVFGYDFFIDSELNVWLIEVNTNPCLEESSPLLGAIIPRMLDDAFKLTVDVLFPQKKPQNQQKISKPVEKTKKEETSENSDPLEKEAKAEVQTSEPLASADKSKCFPLFDYNDNDNLWEHLCSLEFIRTSPKKATIGGGIGNQRTIMKI